jgi:hypothetical protein
MRFQGQVALKARPQEADSDAWGPPGWPQATLACFQGEPALFGSHRMRMV